MTDERGGGGGGSSKRLARPGGAAGGGDPDRTWSYVAALAIEAAVVLALWAFGAHFGS